MARWQTKPLAQRAYLPALFTNNASGDDTSGDDHSNDGANGTGSNDGDSNML